MQEEALGEAVLVMLCRVDESISESVDKDMVDQKKKKKNWVIISLMLCAYMRC